MPYTGQGSTHVQDARIAMSSRLQSPTDRPEQPYAAIGAGPGEWQHRLSLVVQTMREMSLQTDPQAMVRSYIKRMSSLLPSDRMIAVSRRDLEPPRYRITRSSEWKEEINPWKERDRLPVMEGGLLGELVYGDEPRVIDEIQVADDDPSAEYFAGQRSLVAIPQYDRGVALNMVVMMRAQPGAFDRERFPEMVWMSNLFGRATHNLALSEELQTAYDAVDYEMKVVAEIQRSLLPAQLPQIPTLHLAAHYQTSHRAGGDYYDFFELPEGKWGILIADVSGHGTPAAVVMAILHSIAHTYPGPASPPSELLAYANHHLTERYTANNGNFVTAFYGIYDPSCRTLTYVSAGHNPPRIKHCSKGTMNALDAAQTLPLGIMPHIDFADHTLKLSPGDQIIFYTDGITEAMNPAGELFGLERLDQVLEDCSQDADELISAVLKAVDIFGSGRPPDDDRTILIAKIR